MSTDQRRPDTLLLISIIVSLLIGLAAILAFFLIPSSPPAPPPPAAAGPAGGAVPQAAPTPPTTLASPALPEGAAQLGQTTGSDAASAAPPSATVPMVNPADMARSIRAAAAQVEKQPDEAAQLMEELLADMFAHWMRYDTSQLGAAADALIEFMYECSAWPAVVQRISAAIAEPSVALSEGTRLDADRVGPAALSVGLLAKIVAERELDEEALAVATEALEAALPVRPGGRDDPLEGGLIEALRCALPRIVHDPKGGDEPANVSFADEEKVMGALGAWMQVAKAISEREHVRYDRFLVEGVDVLLRGAPPPDEDRVVFGAMRLIASDIRWADGSPARMWLLDWLRDPRVSNDNVRAVIGAALSGPAAGTPDENGLQAVAALGSSDSAEVRVRLADAAAKAWGIGLGVTGTEIAGQWADAARLALQESISESDAQQELSMTLRMSRLNEAAGCLWTGNSPRAAAILGERPNTPQTQPGAPVLPGTGVIRIQTGKSGGASTTASETGWAVRFREAERNIPVRLQRIEEIQAFQSSSVSVVDLEVLVESALFASPSEVKSAAQQAVRRFGEHPATVNSLLEQIPNAPETKSVTQLISDVTGRQLPRPRDPRWKFAARRALVERLIELKAVEVGLADIDQQVVSLAESYRGRAASRREPARTDGVDPSRAAGAALDGVRLLCDELLSEARSVRSVDSGPIDVVRIERLRQGRRLLAAGSVQAFAAEQATAAELLGAMIAAERPARAMQAERVLKSMATARRQTQTVFGQIRHTERAMLELWLTRLGMMLPDDAGPDTTPREGSNSDTPSPWSPRTGGRPIKSPLHQPAPGVLLTSNGPVHQVVPDLDRRLAALGPTRPDGYFLLAEEVASDRTDPSLLALARELYVLSFTLTERSAGNEHGLRRACLGLAELAENEDDRRWLLAMAHLAGAQDAGVSRVEVVEAGAQSDWGIGAGFEAAGLELAHAMGLARAGEGRQAERKLSRPNVQTLLNDAESLFDSAGAADLASTLRRWIDAWSPACPECRNRRTVVRNDGSGGRTILCPTCHGNPGPSLGEMEWASQLAIEAALLHGAHRAWSAQILADNLHRPPKVTGNGSRDRGISYGGTPLRDLDPSELAPVFGVDPAKTTYRDGQWHAPAGAAQSP